MSKLETIAAVLAALCVSIGYADAQVRPGTWVSQASPPSTAQEGQSSPSPPAQASQVSGGSMSGPTQKRPLPKMLLQTLRSCQALSHDAMMQTQRCRLFMKRYAQFVQSDGSLGAPTAPE